MRPRFATRLDSTRLADSGSGCFSALRGSQPSPPRCMYAFYAACTALDAFLSRAAINRRNIEVEAPRVRSARVPEKARELCVKRDYSRARYRSPKGRDRPGEGAQRDNRRVREQEEEKKKRRDRKREREIERVEEVESRRRSRGDKDRERYRRFQ